MWHCLQTLFLWDSMFFPHRNWHKDGGWFAFVETQCHIHVLTLPPYEACLQEATLWPTQPGTSFPLRAVEEAQPFPDAHHYERMSMRYKWQESIVRWLTLPEWAAGGLAAWGGERMVASTKTHWRTCRLGTSLALVLLPFHGTAGGGCCLVLTERRDYFWKNRRGGLWSPWNTSFTLLMAMMSQLYCTKRE